MSVQGIGNYQVNPYANRAAGPQFGKQPQAGGVKFGMEPCSTIACACCALPAIGIFAALALLVKKVVGGPGALLKKLTGK